MADNRLNKLKAYIQTQGWGWDNGKTIPYGEQIIITAGTAAVTLDFYPKRGKMVVGGVDSSLKTAVKAWVDEDTPATTTITGPHIGLDESGKGDWFGPLVVAAVYVDATSAVALRRIGVRDSKALGSEAISRIAPEIERIVSPENYVIKRLMPVEYNQLYARYGNINLLLAELYAQTAAELWRKTNIPTIVCDQFSQRADRLEQAFAAQALPRPRQQHHAEEASIAVAAASILAAATFSAALAELGQDAGLGATLPRGATDIQALEQTAQHIIVQRGINVLSRYAKLNFKPIQELLTRLM